MTTTVYMSEYFGTVNNGNTSWPITRNASAGYAVDTNQVSVGAWQWGFGLYTIDRGFMIFDLSSVPVGDVTSVTLHMYNYNPYSNPVYGSTCIQQGGQGTTLDVNDYSQSIGNSFGSCINRDGWNTITFNLTGKNFVEGCIGSICRLVARDNSYDFPYIQPFVGNQYYLNPYSSFDPDAASHLPYLEIEVDTSTTIAPTTLAPTTAAPTTLAPTTLPPGFIVADIVNFGFSASFGDVSIVTTPAPTTVLTTPAPTTFLTTLAPTTAFRIDDLDLTAYGEGDFKYPEIVPDPLLGTIIDCNKTVGDESIRKPTFGLMVHEVENNNLNLDGSLKPTFNFNVSISAVTLDRIITSDTIDINITVNTSGIAGADVYSKSNIVDLSTVQWSKIGSIDFTIDHSNEAGKAFLRDIGTIYGIRKLGNSVVVYGSDGIGSLTPHETAWGFKLLSKKGLISRDAHNGTVDSHWYIDVDYDLNIVDNEVKKIGYKEYLSELTNPIMLIDVRRKFLYIGDGTKGYVYSYVDGSFGKGYGNLTGFGYYRGDELSCIPNRVYTTPAPTTPPVEIVDLVGEIGYIYHTGTEWYTTRSATSGTSVADFAIFARSQRPASAIIRIYRGVMSFDLSLYSAGRRVLSATWKGYYNHDYGDSSGSGSIQGCTYDGVLDVSDYNCFTGDSFGNVEWADSSWNSIELNEEGIAYIESCLGGDCPLMLREYYYDYLNNYPSIGTSSNIFVITDEPGYEPYLEIQLAPATTLPTTAAPTTVPPSTLIKTDILDFGTRKEKTIESVSISTDVSVDIQVAIEYRVSMKGEFVSTPWVNFNPHGEAFLPCYGIEFRIKVRTLESTQFDIDQLSIKGIIHGAGKTDYMRNYR